jgi:hypothetical protein
MNINVVSQRGCSFVITLNYVGKNSATEELGCDTDKNLVTSLSTNCLVTSTSCSPKAPIHSDLQYDGQLFLLLFVFPSSTGSLLVLVDVANK